MPRRLLVVVPVLFLAACGPVLGAAVAPTQTPYVIVVTATPLPATATPRPAATRTPLPTPTSGPAVAATLTRDTQLFRDPDPGAPRVAELRAGDQVTVRYRGGDWFNVTKGKATTGWVHKDSIELPSDVAEKIAPYPEALPVFVGDIVEESLAGSNVFKGRLVNVGAEDAYQVRVMIETFDSNQTRVELVSTYVDGIDLPAGATASFTASTKLNYDSFVASVRWYER